MTEIIKETIIDPNNQDKEIKVEVETSIYLNEIESGDDAAKEIVKKFQTIKYNLSCQCLDDDFLYEQEYNDLIEKHKNSAKEALSIIFDKEALKCIAWFDRLEM